jgi:hypothetical protein
MTTARPRVSFGDGIRALGTLRPTDEETVSAILSLLGLTAPEELERVAPVQLPTIPTPEPEEPGPPVERESRPVDEGDEDRSPFGEEVPSTLEIHRPTEGKGIEGVPELPEQDRTSLPPIDPLFLRRWVRGILMAAVSVPLFDGPPDVERVVNAVARGEAISDLPRRPAPTLRLGVQLLLDRSTRMTPFLKDEEWLEWALARIVGEDRVELRRFIGTPLRGGAVGGRARTSYEPPIAGTPVLALTDLGIGRPLLDPDTSDVNDWREFAHLLRRAGCSLVAFVPYPPERWPSSLVRELKVIQWDRVTTAASVRGRLGPAAAP